MNRRKAFTHDVCEGLRLHYWSRRPGVHRIVEGSTLRHPVRGQDVLDHVFTGFVEHDKSNDQNLWMVLGEAA
ncbi:hypothetical protein AOT96_04785 [Rhodococcus sp. 008]|nr:hypothetical protein AOT96_04785 [Rhodococcus sp. 008]